MSMCFIVGHGKSKYGGYDSGAVNGNYHEFKIAKEIARYAYEYYKTNYDEPCDLMNYNGDLYLSDRIKEVNKKKYGFVAEIHLNASGGTGTETYYAKGSTTGKNIATTICEYISKALSVRNRGAKIKIGSSGTDYFGIIRQTKCEAVLVETVFIDSKDLEKIKTVSGQKNCGEAIAKAIASARGIKAKVKTPTPVVQPTKKVYYFGKCNAKETSIVDALKEQGYSSSFTYRKKIAAANGIRLYTGASKQNIALLTLMKQGKLIKP